MKRILASVAVLTVLQLGLAAQETLKPSAAVPKLDGTVASGEYQLTKSVKKAFISVTQGSDGFIYFAITSPLHGWVAIGTGSQRMDGASIYMAADGGQPAFSVQAGTGHTHNDAAGDKRIKWAVKSTDSGTTLELALPAELALNGTDLPIIWAYGSTTDMRARHADRGSLDFTATALKP